MSSKQNILVRLKDAGFRINDKWLVKGVSLEIKKGEIVTLIGPNGSGKELVAHQLHEKSERSSFPLIEVNCAAIPSVLIESELFGHVKGAFTGAIANRPGRFQLAHEGTLFLDEIIEETGLEATVKIKFREPYKQYVRTMKEFKNDIMDIEKLKIGTATYKGAKRRFEYVVDNADFVVIDDYAHHPEELNAIIGSVKSLYPSKKITGILPDSIVINEFLHVHDEAHARFDAISRSYSYTLTGERDPFRQETSYHFPFYHLLDFGLMKESIKLLQGYDG